MTCCKDFPRCFFTNICEKNIHIKGKETCQIVCQWQWNFWHSKRDGKERNVTIQSEVIIPMVLTSFTNGCFSKDQCKFTSIEFLIYLVLFVFKILLLLCCHLRNPVWNNFWKLTFSNYLQRQKQASCRFCSERFLKHKTTAGLSIR